MTESLSSLADAVGQHLGQIYPENVVGPVQEKILKMVQSSALHQNSAAIPELSERDVLLISYGDNLVSEGKTPLQTLDTFMSEHLPELNQLHILPFFPFSSDDGFSVIDYLMINPEVGSWDDIRQLGKKRRLMFDFVLNHISRESVWFADFVSNHPPGKDFFIELPANTDVCQVIRP
ncbi:MAG: alpha-amylase family glycosyl hydrolase, partial [Natronospirillum sp.]